MCWSWLSIDSEPQKTYMDEFVVFVSSLLFHLGMCLGTTSPGLWGMGMNPFKTMFALDTMPSYIEHSNLTSARQPDMWRLYLEMFFWFLKKSFKRFLRCIHVPSLGIEPPALRYDYYQGLDWFENSRGGGLICWDKKGWGPESQRLLQVEHDFVAHYCNIVLTKIPRRLWSCIVFFMKLEALLRASVDVKKSHHFGIPESTYVGMSGLEVQHWPGRRHVYFGIFV